MLKQEVEKYAELNELAEASGIVIFGNEEDRSIPLCELKQAFELDSNLYNRSFTKLSIVDALEVYDECIAGLCPETVLLHIGADDLEFFKSSPEEFDKKYCELITHIRQADKKCRIAVISLKNYEKNSEIAELNKHLKYMAESQRCEYGDIASRRIWNPKAAKERASFVNSIGFMQAWKNKRPIYDLVRILFC